MKTGILLPEVLTVKQVAEFFQVSEDTVRKLIRRGDIPSVKEGCSYKVLRIDLLAYLESLKKGRKMAK